MFFPLFYDDHWRVAYAQHREEIESVWRGRGWTKKQRRFVMTDYYQRGFVLEHDRRREEEMRLWQEWRAREGWETEAFPRYLERRMQEKNGIT
jgi:hypothetical protein